MSNRAMQVFLEEVDKRSEPACFKWARKAADVHAILRIGFLPVVIIPLVILFTQLREGSGIILINLFLAGACYTFYKGVFVKNFNYRITEKGVRVIYWDDYPEIAAQSLHFLAGVYILVAIIAGLYMGPLAFAGAGGIGLAHAMGMQKISRNEKQRLITWEDFDRVTVCRKRNVLDWHCLYRIYFTDVLSIEEFLDFANQHRVKPVEVVEDEPILYS